LLGVLKKLKIDMHSVLIPIIKLIFEVFSLTNFDVSTFDTEYFDFINVDCLYGESKQY